jgi:hypothetical protein
LSNGYTSTTLSVSTWKWPLTRWRHTTTSWPTQLDLKKATECDYTPYQRGKTPKTHTLSPIKGSQCADRGSEAVSRSWGQA